MSVGSLRGSLADVLTAAGVQTYPYAPQTADAPFAVVKPGLPFMEAGPGFGEKTVRFDLYIVVETDAEEELDQLVSLAIKTLDDEYEIENIVIEPQIGDGVLSGAVLTLTQEVALEDIYS